MTPAVSADGVSKHYGDTVALSDVSISVSSGEIFVLVGPNGAGKTTLVRALTGTIEPDTGAISVLETPVNDTDPSRIGLLPQSFAPHDRLTARELLRYYAGLYDQSLAVSKVLSDVGLTEASETRYANLSGGQKRRVCVGSALINDPEVLFLDEPTTGIDPAGRRSVWSLLNALSDNGATIVLTTHDMAEAAALGDRVALLDDGELVESGSPGSLIDQYGGESILRIEIEDQLSEAQVGQFDGDIEQTPSGLHVRNVQPDTIGQFVTQLNELEIRYGSITWTEPSLEDAYLHLTGNDSVGSGTGFPESPAYSDP
jgi:ABC-2 type transport system ATP-binding protein